jgi:hypothetical protein
MMPGLSGLSLLAIGLVLAAASAPRQPTGRWTVDFDDAQCVASRNYGSAENPLQLIIKSPAIGNVVQVGFMRPDAQAETTIVYSKVTIDTAKPFATDVLAFTPTGSKQRAFVANLPGKMFAQLESANTIAFSAHGFDERFAISAMPPLMKILQECVSDLRAVWPPSGPDRNPPELKVPPMADLNDVLRGLNYPGVLRAKNYGGAVKAVLLIDEAGKVADCTVVETSGFFSLGVQACALISERGKFKPANGVDGKAAKSSILQSIDWRAQIGLGLTRLPVGDPPR